MELKIKNKNLFLIAVLLMGTGTQFFNYGCNTAMTPLLKEINGYHLYSLAAALGSTGMMVALPAVGALGGKDRAEEHHCDRRPDYAGLHGRDLFHL